MSLSPEQLEVIEAEVRAINREARDLPPRAAERRYRFLAIMMENAGLPRTAEAAGHAAVTFSATGAAVDYLDRTIAEEVRAATTQQTLK